MTKKKFKKQNVKKRDAGREAKTTETSRPSRKLERKRVQTKRYINFNKRQETRTWRKSSKNHIKHNEL